MPCGGPLAISLRARPIILACSSDGESTGPINRGSQVRFLPGQQPRGVVRGYFGKSARLCAGRSRFRYPPPLHGGVAQVLQPLTHSLRANLENTGIEALLGVTSPFKRLRGPPLRGFESHRHRSWWRGRVVECSLWASGAFPSMPPFSQSDSPGASAPQAQACG